jgi:DNA-binding NtrC family response regulator
LRSRKSDIPLLAAHFISLVCKRLNRAEPRLTQADVKQLQAYHWPGNIRELQNVIERAIIISRDGRLEFDLPKMEGESKNRDLTTTSTTAGSDDNQPFPYTEEERLQRDRINILAALKLTNGKVSGKQGAAELLGMKPTTLASRMNALGIEKSK